MLYVISRTPYLIAMDDGDLELRFVLGITRTIKLRNTTIKKQEGSKIHPHPLENRGNILKILHKGSRYWFNPGSNLDAEEIAESMNRRKTYNA